MSACGAMRHHIVCVMQMVVWDVFGVALTVSDSLFILEVMGLRLRNMLCYHACDFFIFVVMSDIWVHIPSGRKTNMQVYIWILKIMAFVARDWSVKCQLVIRAHFALSVVCTWISTSPHPCVAKKLLIRDWRAGHTISLSIYFCDMVLHVLLIFSDKGWLHFCYAFHKDFFNWRTGDNLLDLVVRGVTCFLLLVVSHMDICLPSIIL
jgi:hypothetical protein